MLRNDSVHCIWTLIDISECIFSALSSDIYCAHFQHPKSRAVSDFCSETIAYTGYRTIVTFEYWYILTIQYSLWYNPCFAII